MAAKVARGYGVVAVVARGYGHSGCGGARRVLLEEESLRVAVEWGVDMGERRRAIGGVAALVCCVVVAAVVCARAVRAREGCLLCEETERRRCEVEGASLSFVRNNEWFSKSKRKFENNKTKNRKNKPNNLTFKLIPKVSMKISNLRFGAVRSRSKKKKNSCSHLVTGNNFDFF